MTSGIWGHVRRNAIAYAALLIALSGTAYAANRIDTADIARDAVVSRKVGDDTLKSKDLKDGKAVKSRDVKDGTLRGDDIAEETVTGANVLDDSLTADDIDESTFSGTLRLAIPPSGWVSFGIPDAEVDYFIGTAIVEQGGANGSRGVVADIPVPIEVGARPMRLVSYELCYDAAPDAELSSVGVRTIVSTTQQPFLDTTVISDDTNRTDQRCRLFEPDSEVVFEADEFLEASVGVNFSGGEFRIYRTTVVLEPA